MIELFDTHAHFEGGASETAALLERAFAEGVTRVAAIGGSFFVKEALEKAGQ